MAAAARQTRERNVTTIERYWAVVLELSGDEALFLADVLAKIAGDPDTTRLRHQAAIADALESAGVHGGHAPDLSGRITASNTRR